MYFGSQWQLHVCLLQPKSGRREGGGGGRVGTVWGWGLEWGSVEEGGRGEFEFLREVGGGLEWGVG